MTYPKNLNKLISYIPAEVYAESEKEITEIADAIATDRQKLKEAVLELTTGESYCHVCERYQEFNDGPHEPDCIAGQLLKEEEEE